MAETPEARVKRAVRDILLSHYSQQPTTGGYGRSGQLDFTCCISGRYLAIEVKSIYSKYGSKGPTPLQWREIDAVRVSGGVAASIDETNLDDLKDIVAALLGGAPHSAKQRSLKTTRRHDRTRTTPETDTQPVVRKRNIKQEK